MSLFAKCLKANERVEHLRSIGQFFYLRQFDPAATPYVAMKDRQLIMLGSNNYLGLVMHPYVVEAAVRATREYGTGTCSSRLLTGSTSLHAKLEHKLAQFKRTEDAVVFTTGFMTMMGTLAAVTGPGDVILSDELNHACIVDGCRLSKAQVMIYRHNDMASLEDKLSRCAPSTNKLIVTDGVFSMKGTVANLPEIKRLADQYGAKVMVDDAHGTGVLGASGRGTLEYFNMEGEIDIVCGTFSKAFCTVGGFTASNEDVIKYLKHNARAFLFTASPPPAVIATVLACLEVIEREPETLDRLHRNTRFMKNGLGELGFVLEETLTPIIPMLINDESKTFQMVGGLEEEGVIVNPVVHPAVPRGSELIRVSVMASLSLETLATSLDKFEHVGKRIGLI